MKASSSDLRRSILEAVDSNLPKALVARNFGVARSTIMRYVAQRRVTGTVEPKPNPGRAGRLAPVDYAALVVSQPRQCEPPVLTCVVRSPLTAAVPRTGLCPRFGGWSGGDHGTHGC